jgi:cysteine-rich repeat protein
MKHAATTFFFAVVFCAASVGSAQGAVVGSADEVCAPSADPCVISSIVEVDALEPLDFGLRTVRVIAPGAFVGTLDLTCGRFVTATDGLWMTVPNDVVNGDVTITANRRCSLDTSLACLSDTVCTSAGAGLCSAGDGGIAIQGKLKGNAPTVTLRAAGDVLLEGTMTVTSSPPAEYGGTFLVESSFGSIDSTAEVNASGGSSDAYDVLSPAYGGSVSLRAPIDVTLRGKILATGGSAYVEVDAGRDTFVIADILTQGRQGGGYIGGTIDLHAGRDLNVIREGGARPVLNIAGGQETASGYGYGGLSYAGPGGYAFLNAGRDVVVGEKVGLMGDSGISIGLVDDQAISGDWYFEAGEDLDFDAVLSDRAWGVAGSANHGVSLYGDNSVRMGRHGRITTAGEHAGDVVFRSADGGAISIEGRVNVRSRKITYSGYGYSYSYGRGGNVSVYGGDVSIRGKIMNGGPTGAGDIYMDVCRLHLQPGSRVDTSWEDQVDYVGGTAIRIRESMIADKGSKIRGKFDAIQTITYRDAAKAPQLNGSITPTPDLAVNSLMYGCPVCGNFEIDESETCDDGNLLDGDGCDSMCNVTP